MGGKIIEPTQENAPQMVDLGNGLWVVFDSWQNFVNREMNACHFDKQFHAAPRLSMIVSISADCFIIQTKSR